MAKNLVIVESPAKAKTIGKYLGRDYAVISSMGHVRDLPPSKLGVDLTKDFEPQYVVIKGKTKLVAQIKAKAKEAENIYLACDPDREGEAIAWHIAAEIKEGKKKKIHRIMFYEITKESIKSGIAHPGKIDNNKVEAQQARRILDRIVGYQVSPYLWTTVRRGLSAGRVQTVALRLICEREDEIKAFKPQEYWSLAARLQGKEGGPFEALLFKIDGKKAAIKDKPAMDQVLAGLKAGQFTVENLESKDKKRNTYPPFITSTLQQAAFRAFGYSAKKTMMLAQQLYEGIELGDEGATGLITYMRTDAVRLAPEAIAAAREYIKEKFGAGYLPPEPLHYKSRKGAQEGHEAIRPSAVERHPDKIKGYLTPEQHKVYGLIYSRFLACQMNPAIYLSSTADIACGKYLFRVSGNTLKFNGFLAAYGIEEDDSAEYGDSKSLPPLTQSEVLKLAELLPKQHFTEPPPRYNVGSLIKILEAQGIGRPSTYATIVSTLVDREYILQESGRFSPTELGQVVSRILIEKFPDIFEVQFTADMETELDKIEQGKLDRLQVLKDFYAPFSKDLKAAEAGKAEMKKSLEEKTDLKCPNCQAPMIIKWGRFGKFYACSNYPECKTTKPLEEEEDQKIAAGTCEKCGSPMAVKRGRFGKFLACTNYPKCENIKSITTGVPCPEPGCTGELTERRSKRGKNFYSCSRYPDCKYASWNKPVNQACPSCGFGHLSQKYSKAKGNYIACSKCKHEPEEKKEGETKE
jgi:DNA topoisomerase-1